MVRISWFAAPGEVVDHGAALAFGRLVAEEPIQDDMRTDAALGPPGVQGLFVDTSVNDADDHMIVWMGLRGKLPGERVGAMRDYRWRGARGLRDPGRPPPLERYTDLPEGHWSRPDVVCHTSAAHEYYEIKPRSASGPGDARKKFPNIDRFIAEFGLPYTRGTKYMPNVGFRRKEILTNNPVLRPLLNNLMRLFKLQSIRVFVIWERPEPAMILYALRIEIETSDDRDERTMEHLSRFVLRLAIQSKTPGADLLPAPQGVAMAELPAELSAFKQTVEASAGGMVLDGVPGETHLLVIEEGGFKRILQRIRQLPPLLRGAAAGPLFKAEEWRRALRQSAAEQAQLRDQVILIAGAMLLGGVALYVCWPLIGAGAAIVATESAVGSEAAFLSQAFSTIGRQVARNGLRVLQGGLSSQPVVNRAMATARMASGLQRAAGGLQRAAGFPLFVFGSVNETAGAESIALTGTVDPSFVAFDMVWLLRPNTFSGPGPGQFGSVLDVAPFGLVRGARPGDPQPSSKMRLIGKVRFS